MRIRINDRQEILEIANQLDTEIIRLNEAIGENGENLDDEYEIKVMQQELEQISKLVESMDNLLPTETDIEIEIKD